MNACHYLHAIQWLPVAVLTVLSFAFGALWHAPFLFGRLWTKENHIENVKKEINAPLVFGGAAVLHFIALAGLSAITSCTGALHGLETGLLVSLIWVFPAMGVTYLFANRSLKLLAVDLGFYVVLFGISGLVLGIG